MSRTVGIDEFVLILDQAKEKARTEINKFLVLFILACCEEIIVGGEYGPGTPVDTGFLRAMWWLDIDGGGSSPDLARPSADQLRGRKGNEPFIFATNDWETGVLGLQAGQQIALNNNTEYAPYVENGTDHMAPRAMVKTVVNAAGAIAQRVARDLGWDQSSLIRLETA